MSTEKMSTEKVKAYLSMAADMEASCYVMRSLRRELREEIRNIERKELRALLSPDAPPAQPLHPKAEKKGVNAKLAGLLSAFATLAVLLPTTAVLSEGVHPAILACSCAAPSLVFGVLGYTVCNIRNAESPEYTRKPPLWGKGAANWPARKKVQQPQASSSFSVNQCMSAYLKAELSLLQRRLSEAEACLRQIYSKNVVYEKYRNLSMICSLNEFLESGRCSELEGPLGAYNRLEAELSKGRICMESEELEMSLSQIERNQYALYTAIQLSEDILDEIWDDNIEHLTQAADIARELEQNPQKAQNRQEVFQRRIDALVDTSKAQAYLNERFARELEYIRRSSTIAS